jgi:hypothetical protein
MKLVQNKTAMVLNQRICLMHSWSSSSPLPFGCLSKNNQSSLVFTNLKVGLLDQQTTTHFAL